MNIAFNKAMANNKLEFIRLYLDDTGILQQIPQISGPSLHPFVRHTCIFEILQDLSVAEIKW